MVISVACANRIHALCIHFAQNELAVTDVKSAIARCNHCLPCSGYLRGKLDQCLRVPASLGDAIEAITKSGIIASS